MGDKYIDIEFSYNGNLGRLQQKTIDNKIFAGRLLQNGIISREEYREYMQKISEYFVQEINKVAENPHYYIDTIGGWFYEINWINRKITRSIEV